VVQVLVPAMVSIDSSPTSKLATPIVEDLRRRVLGGVLKPGEAVLEVPLAARYGVSRGPVRDALRVLAQDGLLEFRPNIGARVAAPPPPWQRELMVGLRRDLEHAALRRIVASPALALALTTNLQAYLSACRAHDLAQVVELDLDFHRRLVAAAAPELLGLWRSIIHRLFLRYDRHQDLAESHAEHAAIATALLQGEVERAAEKLRQHIQ
jgi:GntR family transcriptional regulator, rspAB operon transcriptional repressor